MIEYKLKEKELKMKLKNALNWYFHSNYYLATLCFVVSFCWFFDVFLLGALVSLTLGGISLFVSDDVMAVFPPIIAIPYMFKSLYFADYIKYIPFVAVVFALIVVGIIYFLVKKIKFEKVKVQRGKLFYGIVIAYSSMVFAGAFSLYFNWLHLLAMIGIGFMMYAVYWLFVNFGGKNMANAICKIVIMMAMIVILEMWLFYLSHGNIAEAMAGKLVRVGMGEINTAAQYIALAIPCSLYLGLKNEKFDWLLILFAFFLYINIFFTLSRTVILFSTLCLPILFVYAIIKNKNKVKMWASFCCLLIFAIFFVIIFRDKVSHAFSWLFNIGLSGNGRGELWAFCFNIFKENPIFGGGFILPFNYDYGPAASNLILAHNTPLQLLTSLGIVGTLGHMLFYVQKYRTFVEKISQYKFFMLIGIIMVGLFGMFDPTFVNLLMTMIVYAMIANAEKETDEERVALDFKLGGRKNV